MEKKPQAYRHRSYRRAILKNNLIVYNVTIGESDLFISSDTDLQHQAYQSTLQERIALQAYIRQHPSFQTTLAPWPEDPLAPPLVRDMIAAGAAAGVGPMAAVAGAIAERVGQALRTYSRNVIVENGGDLFLDAQQDLRVGLYAGPSAFGERLCLQVRSEEMPLGLCTSSGTVGHSLSLGAADAVCVKAASAALADAAATALGNRVKGAADIPSVLEVGMKLPGVLGVLIVCQDRLGVVGEMTLASP